MAEKGQSYRSVASYLNLGPKLASSLSSLVERSRQNTRKEEQPLSEGDCPSFNSTMSDDDFIIIDEDINKVDGIGETSSMSDDPAVVYHREGEYKSRKLPLPLTSIQQRFLHDKAFARSQLCHKLEQQGFKATFDFDHAEVNIETQGSEGVNVALSTIEKSVMETKVDFTEEELQKIAVMTDVPDGEPVSPFPMLASDQEILVVVDRVDGSMKIVGLTDTIHEVREALKRSQELLTRQTISAVPQDSDSDNEQDDKVRSKTKVRVLFKRLETQQADVLVNTTNTNLLLGLGNGVSNSLFKAAGNSIQQELKAVHPHGIAHGDLAFLVSVVFRSLIKASGDGHQSIAFPALGTGALKYPVKNVVQLMFKAIDVFSLDLRGGSIKEIFIIIAPQTRLEIKQLFLAHQSTHRMKTRQLSGPKHREAERADKPKCEVRVNIGDTLLQVIYGDIKTICDVTDTVLVPWIGEEINFPDNQSALRCLNPDRHQWSCHAFVSGLPQSRCISDSTTLSGKTLIHTYTNHATEKGMCGAVRNALEKATSENSRMIAIPIPAEGCLAARPADSASVIIRAIKAVRSSVFVVTVVIPTDNIFIDFVTRLAEIKKPEAPVDIDMTSLVDTLWRRKFSG